MPAPRVGNCMTARQSPGRDDSLWEGFFLQSALFLLPAVVNNDGAWPVVLCETYYLPEFWKNYIFLEDVEARSLLPINTCPLIICCGH